MHHWSPGLALSLLCVAVPGVRGQGRFLDDLLRMRNDQAALDKESIKKMLESIATAVFGPHDSEQVEHWSGVFLLQEGQAREAELRQRFARTGNNIEFKTYDFTKSNEDDSFVSEIFNNEVEMLSEMSSSTRDPLRVSQAHLEGMLSSVFSLPRHHETDPGLKDEVGGYIWAKFGMFGMVTGVQSYQYPEAPRGNNILGILPGRAWGTASDRVLVVGAHWDTVSHTGGLDDNGSGAAAVLEVARALGQGNCDNNNTVILVTYDLEEMGAVGSLEFVQEFLLPRILLDPELKPRCQFSGAIILDCVLNYDNTEDSQDMEEDWNDIVPGAAANIMRNKKRGNFISAFGRNLPSDQHLAETFRTNWNRNNPDTDIHFENFLMQRMSSPWNNISVIADHLNLLRSDHSQFWIINNKEYFSSLPAILLSDLGPYRGYMRECYHSQCDTFNMTDTNINWDFYTHTVQSLIDSVVQLSGSQCSSERTMDTMISRNQTEIFFKIKPAPLPGNNNRHPTVSNQQIEISDNRDETSGKKEDHDNEIVAEDNEEDATVVVTEGAEEMEQGGGISTTEMVLPVILGPVVIPTLVHPLPHLVYPPPPPYSSPPFLRFYPTLQTLIPIM